MPGETAASSAQISSAGTCTGVKAASARRIQLLWPPRRRTRPKYRRSCSSYLDLQEKQLSISQHDDIAENRQMRNGLGNKIDQPGCVYLRNSNLKRTDTRCMASLMLPRLAAI